MGATSGTMMCNGDGEGLLLHVNMQLFLNRFIQKISLFSFGSTYYESFMYDNFMQLIYRRGLLSYCHKRDNCLYVVGVLASHVCVKFGTSNANNTRTTTRIRGRQGTLIYS